MANDTWNGPIATDGSPVPEDFNSPSYWSSLSTPQSGDAIIGPGLVEITSKDTLPATLTFSLGYQKTGLFTGITSILDVIGTNLSSGVTIDATASGGDFTGVNATLIGAVLEAEGAVQSQAAIHVGAGDELVIASVDASGSSGNFINSGVIDATGTASNRAILVFNGSAAATADYGDISLQYASMAAQVNDSGAGTVSLASSSTFFALANLQQTNADFLDAFGRLDIGQNAAGVLGGTGSTAEYAFGGTIENFQSGDSIGLMQTDSSAVPASVSYDSQTDALTIYDANKDVLGELHVTLAATTDANDQFVLVQHAQGVDFPGNPSSPYDYASQYDIDLVNVSLQDTWTGGGVPADFNTSSDWSHATPVSGDTAIIGQGDVEITGNDTRTGGALPSELTFSLGYTMPGAFTVPSSILNVIDTMLSSGVTIDVTGIGGSFTGNVDNTLIGAALLADGLVTSNATINVGAGDALVIAPQTDASSAGNFVNAGVIDATGNQDNYADLVVQPASAGAMADYGDINLTFAALTALATDESLSSSTVTLASNSLFFDLAGLEHTNASFSDATDRLDIGQSAAGYVFGGTVENFQSGDVIGLMQTNTAAIPASVTYQSGQLTISDANGKALGTLAVQLASGASGQFVLVDQTKGADFPSGSGSAYDYASQYDIGLASDVWIGGAGNTIDFNTASAWSNGIPVAGSVALINAGFATLTTAGEQPVATPITILMGAAALNDSLVKLANGTGPNSTAGLSQGNGNDLGSGVTLDVTLAGGEIAPGVTGTLMLAGSGANGAITSAATVNVGAGDAYSVGIASGANSAIPGSFVNDGVFNLDGVAGNFAFAQFKQGNQGANSAANAYAAYGTINLNSGIFFAKAPDDNPASPNTTVTYGAFNLSDDSTVALFATLNSTGVNFLDKTDTLLVQENGGHYAYGGAISGLQSGDVIGLLAGSDNPASVKFNATTGVLTILDGATNAIGTLNFTGNYSGDSFSLGTATTDPITGATEYKITCNASSAPAVSTLNSLTVAAGTTYPVGQLVSGVWSPGALNVRTFVTVNGALDIDDSIGATGGGELVAGGALTVNSGGVLAIGDSAATITAPTLVAAASLANAGTIGLVGDKAQVQLKIGSAAGTGTAGALSGNISLTGDAVLQFASGAISTLNGGLTLSGAQASVGLLDGAGVNSALDALTTISSGARLDLEAGASVDSALAVTNDGIVDIDVNDSAGGSNFAIKGELTNVGALNIGDSALQTSAGANVGQLLNEGAINLAQSQSQGFTDLNIGGAVENAGTIDGAGSINSSVPTPTYTFTNDSNGHVTVTDGHAIFLSGFKTVLNSGSFTITGGAINASDPFSDTVGTAFSNSGSVVLTNVGSDFANFGVYGSLDNTGTITGQGFVDEMMSTGGVLTNAGGQINVAAGDTINLSNFTTVTNSGSFGITGGAIGIGSPSGPAETTFDNAGMVTLADAGVLNTGELTVDGTLENQQGGEIFGEGRIIGNGSGKLTNDAGATIDGTTANGLSIGTGWQSIENDGLIETTNGNLTIGAPLEGSGDLTAQGAGALTVDQGVTASGTWTYQAEAGGVLRLDGGIAESGDGSGTLAADGGTIFLGGDVTGSISGEISNGGQINASGAFNGDVTFSGSGGELDLSKAYSGTIKDFDASDTIFLTALDSTTPEFFNPTSTDSVTIQSGGDTYVLQFDSSVAQDIFQLNGDALTVTPATAACYCRGTRILTERGDIAVEKLQVGDLAITASGASRPVVWIGHRRVDVARHRDPASVWPVRIDAHAFGDNLPRRDLWVSPGHNIAWEGALIPACALVNGVSVAQVETGVVDYWHVELDAHDILLAEGLPAESYLDCGNRTDFANGGAFVVAHPDFLPKTPGETCLPLAKQGPAVERAKARLRDRLLEQGYLLTADAAPHVRAGGRRIEPVWLSDRRMAFHLPADQEHIVLQSDVFTPAHALPGSDDTRALGLCVTRLMIDGDLAPLDDARLAQGWREAEGGDGGWRWTDGAARLPAGARAIIVDLGGDGLYWRAPVDAVVALFG